MTATVPGTTGPGTTVPGTTGPTMTDAGANGSLRALAASFLVFLESGEPPPGLFAPEVFCDFTMPRWRLQAEGAEAAVALRRHGHPAPGRVPHHRFDPMPTGFVLEVEEEWDSGGEHWYCRELFRADVSQDGITALSVYCTGDWDRARVAEHAAAVTLSRP